MLQNADESRKPVAPRAPIHKNSTMKSTETIIADLAGILADFQGREYSGVIDGNTMILADLGFSSIDVVILGETLESHYGTSLPFGAFLAELGQRNVQDLNAGELAAFLQKHVG